MVNFDLLEKGLGLVSLLHFVYDFSRKIFFMLRFISWLNVIVWLSFLLEILGNMRIVIIIFPIDDIINFEIKLSFLFKPFFMTWISLEWKELLSRKKKHSFFINFKGLLAPRNWFRPGSRLLGKIRITASSLSNSEFRIQALAGWLKNNIFISKTTEETTDFPQVSQLRMVLSRENSFLWPLAGIIFWKSCGIKTTSFYIWGDLICNCM